MLISEEKMSEEDASFYCQTTQVNTGLCEFNNYGCLLEIVKHVEEI
jgi:hypothetical protein